MKRRESKPRDGWRATVEKQGLLYAVTPRMDGTITPYWYESACYSFNMAEVEYLEAVTEGLHGMCLEAARRVLGKPDLFAKFNLDPKCLPYLLSTIPEPSIYGRFDLAFKDLMTGDAKMLEYNADTPTGLVEGSIAQWYWLQDVHPDKDQWNSLHERLVQAWRKQHPFLPDTLHFAHSKEEKSGEEWMTVAYMRDVAIEAGYRTYGIYVEDIGVDAATSQFVGLTGEPIRACFKLYPWEDMLTDEFGPAALSSSGKTQWIEPAWKAILSNKALLAVLWEMYPNHPNLLPAYFDEPRDLVEWIAKPLHGREGDGIKVQTPTYSEERDATVYGPEGYVYQQWHELPQFDGNYAVLGSWVVDGKAAGVGIRESDGPVTDYYARFVPNLIDSPAPSKAQVEAWLKD